MEVSLVPELAARPSGSLGHGGAEWGVVKWQWGGVGQGGREQGTGPASACIAPAAENVGVVPGICRRTRFPQVPFPRGKTLSNCSCRATRPAPAPVSGSFEGEKSPQWHSEHKFGLSRLQILLALIGNVCW